MKRLKYILSSKKYLYISILIISLLYSLTSNFLIEKKSIYQGSENEIIGTIEKIKIDGDKLSLEVNAKERVIANYYFTSLEEKETLSKSLELGSTVKLIGVLTVPSNNTIFNLFNYKEYLYHKNIFYMMNVETITKIKNNTNIINYFKNTIIKKLESYDNSEYLKAFILGDKNSLNSEINNSYQRNGIAHLLAISGMHVSLFIGLLNYLCKHLRASNKFIFFFISIFLLFYLVMCDFAPSLFRAALMNVLILLFKMLNIKVSTKNILFLTISIILFINPSNLLNLGFQLSVIISFNLILLSKKISKINNYFLKILYISYISFLSSMPLIINSYYELNFLGIILNIFFVPLVSIFIFPLALLTFLFPILDSILSFFVLLLENVSLFFKNITVLTFTFSKINILGMIIYYVVIYLTFYKKKILYVLLIMLIIHNNSAFFKSETNITFLDVGQGDSILITLPKSKGNILIDTGGFISYQKEKWQERNKNYSIALDKLILYFKSIGLKNIDYLIISHGDYDHMGEAINLVENFKVEKVILNCGEFNELETDLIKILDKKKIKYYSCIKELDIDDNKLYFLNSKNYDNENDNSSVIYTELNNYKFLFMGDAGVEVEEELIKKYNLKDIDILKVGHHGSKTSSSKNFINEINPKYSIMSVGKNNRYGHPNKEVLNNLDNSKIYRTDIDGSIMFKIKNNKLQIETCVP